MVDDALALRPELAWLVVVDDSLALRPELAWLVAAGLPGSRWPPRFSLGVGRFFAKSAIRGRPNAFALAATLFKPKYNRGSLLFALTCQHTVDYPSPMARIAARSSPPGAPRSAGPIPCEACVARVKNFFPYEHKI